MNIFDVQKALKNGAIFCLFVFGIFVRKLRALKYILLLEYKG